MYTRLPDTSVFDLEAAFYWSNFHSNCATISMNTRSQKALPPLPTETFEELMEISQIPQEELPSRVSLHESKFAQPLNGHEAQQLHCDGLTKRVKCLETSLANTLSRKWQRLPASARRDDWMFCPKHRHHCTQLRHLLKPLFSSEKKSAKSANAQPQIYPDVNHSPCPSFPVKFSKLFPIWRPVWPSPYRRPSGTHCIRWTMVGCTIETP